MPLPESRRLFWSIGMSLALQAMTLVAMGPVVPGRAEAASPASDRENSIQAVSGKPLKIVQVSADLSRDLDRLEKRGAGGEVFDLFSPSVGSSSLQKGKAGGKRVVPVQPAKGEEDEVEVITNDTVVLVQPQPQPLEPVVALPAPAPVVSVPLPPAIPVTPPVVAAPPPPPPPKPPAVPFAYIGKFEEGERTVYFLVKGDKLYMVKAGEDIDEAYSFDGEAGNQLRLTYKPLRIAQTLTVGP
ncbi:MAG: hypothetical protein CAF44_005170 [Nitrospira sp. CG24D]|nr:MAG: hypothetical protein CAF44_005170 [Nitrospira sp. CG24D]